MVFLQVPYRTSTKATLINSTVSSLDFWALNLKPGPGLSRFGCASRLSAPYLLPISLIGKPGILRYPYGVSQALIGSSYTVAMEEPGRRQTGNMSKLYYRTFVDKGSKRAMISLVYTSLDLVNDFIRLKVGKKRPEKKLKDKKYNAVNSINGNTNCIKWIGCTSISDYLNEPKLALIY